MTEENQEVKDQEPQVLDAHPDEINDSEVSGYFTVLTDLDDSVSISFSIRPTDGEKGIGSITTGFFRSQSGVLKNSWGATNFSVTPAAAGQAMTGGTSEKIGAFTQLPAGEIYEAVLQGTLKKNGESSGAFFLSKVVQVGGPGA